MVSQAEVRRKMRVRAQVRSQDRARLSVHRSLSHIYAQIIDDQTGTTLAASSTLSLKVSGNKTEAARAVGQDIAQKALAHGITKVVFDRGSSRYHGRVKALAEGAREGGLEF